MKRIQDNIVRFIDGANDDIKSLPNIVSSSTESQKRIEQLNTFVEDVMVKGVDYGLINGFSKPTLLKPGAEKLCDVFGFSKTAEVTNRLEDWDRGIFAYEVKVTLIQKENQVIEAEGIGSCNSKEASFRQQDSFTIVNTVLKMAKKRALIDAVLSATRSSGIFTQDIEDFPKSQKPTADRKVTKDQLQLIFNIVDEMKLPTEIAKEILQNGFNVNRSKELTQNQASDFIQFLLIFKDIHK
ncbi:hypothetical protein [Jeotgalibacillus proteolyticus]|uniref:Uncharacterized protein n=1 Tax=Jeotgalibacillus proteolyticus TaxID=2082395 RepID=A0A2S5G954_9BACL|nr:hypothetical protein [Jeotgalibacillus proteolyticus]PPA69444.1 hypothetical protein C4B60_16820 [Jeotgalibacillus proteolyticus]